MIATIKLLEQQLINIRSSITRVRNQLSADKVTDLELYRQSKATLKELLKFEKSVEANLAWELKALERKGKIMGVCMDSRCGNGVCMGHCGGKKRDHQTDSLLYMFQPNQTLSDYRMRTLEIAVKDYHLLLRHRTGMMWFAWVGWALTAVILLLVSMGVL